MNLLLALVLSPAFADCPPPPAPLQDLRRLVDEQRDILAPARYADWMMAQPQCVDVLLEQRDLAQVFQLAGMVTQLSDPTAAQAYFLAGATLVGDVRIDPALGPDAAAAWAAALDEVAARPRAYIVAQSAVWVDGREVASGQVRTLPAGWHLVQEVGPLGAHTQGLTLQGGERREVGDPASTVPMARASQHRPLIVTGVVLQAVGIASLVGFSFVHHYDHTNPGNVRAATLGILYDGGLGAVVAGAGVLVIGTTVQF